MGRPQTSEFNLGGPFVSGIGPRRPPLDDSETTNVNPRDLKSEEGTEDLVPSAKARPYLHVAEAMLKEQGLPTAFPKEY